MAAISAPNWKASEARCASVATALDRPPDRLLQVVAPARAHHGADQRQAQVGGDVRDGVADLAVGEQRHHATHGDQHDGHVQQVQRRGRNAELRDEFQRDLLRLRRRRWTGRRWPCSASTAASTCPGLRTGWRRTPTTSASGAAARVGAHEHAQHAEGAALLRRPDRPWSGDVMAAGRRRSMPAREPQRPRADPRRQARRPANSRQRPRICTVWQRPLDSPAAIVMLSSNRPGQHARQVAPEPRARRPRTAVTRNAPGPRAPHRDCKARRACCSVAASSTRTRRHACARPVDPA